MELDDAPPVSGKGTPTRNSVTYTSRDTHAALSNDGMRQKLHTVDDSKHFKVKLGKESPELLAIAEKHPQAIISDRAGENYLNKLPVSKNFEYIKTLNNTDYVQVFDQLLSLQKENRKVNQMMKYTALLSDIPYFIDRRMKEPAMAEVLSLWQIRSVPKSEFVFEYGTYGTDYYFILDGQVEIQLPHKSAVEEFKEITFEIQTIKDKLLKKREALEAIRQTRKTFSKQKTINEKK